MDAHGGRGGSVAVSASGCDLYMYMLRAVEGCWGAVGVGLSHACVVRAGFIHAYIIHTRVEVLFGRRGALVTVVSAVARIIKMAQLEERQLEELRQIFDLFDGDGDGLLEVEEVGTIWASCGTLLTEAEVNAFPDLFLFSALSRP